DSPVHTPAAADSPLLSEQVFECGLQIGCERVHSQFHATFHTAFEKTEVAFIAAQQLHLPRFVILRFSTIIKKNRQYTKSCVREASV
ncbi:MAG: hypothetical protein WCD37_11875, partial [Chloroflexia bacterium]